jgi:hypothetical protein
MISVKAKSSVFLGVLIYRMALKSVNPKQSLMLTGIFRFKPASQCVERYHSVVSCSLDMGDLISNNFCKFSKQ